MDKNNLTMHDLSRIERPREKLARYGPEKLSNAELLALIVRTGCRGQSALKISEKLLKNFGARSLPELVLKDLRSVPGIGQAKACEIVACFELARRLLNDKKSEIFQISSPQDLFDQLRDICALKKEHFIIFYLDSRNQSIKREIISIGSLNASLVHPREVFEPAIKNLAAQIVLAHNHPSGNLEPSDDDLSLTRRLVQAGQLLGIEVLEHLIVTKEAYFSFKEHGLV